MTERVFDERTLVHYLLGELSEEERVRVETSFFESDAMFDQLAAAENDLIDDYVRGRLPADLQTPFQKKLRSDNNWKRRVAFAEALAQRVSGPAPPPQSVASTEPFFRTLLAFLRGQQPVFQAAVAAAGLVIVIGFVWLASETIQARRNMQALETQRQNLEKAVAELKGQVAGLQQDGQKLSSELDQERAARRELENKRPDTNSPLGLVASFVLRAGIVRGADDAAHLKIPAGAGTVRLRLEVNPAEDYPTFKAELRTAAGAMVWNGETLRAQNSGGSKIVNLDVPAQRLRAGNYEIALLGRSDSGKLEDVAFYYFTVE